MNSHITNQINLAISKKVYNISIKFSRKSINLVKILYSIGFIKNYYVAYDISRGKSHRIIRFSCFYFNNRPFYKSLSVVSTPSKKFTVSIKALRTINTCTESSILILSTSKGVITDKQALILGVGGTIILSIS